ncbi:hypothetical protein ALP01_05381 [Pseudomonas caricapapayae]|nr:hypothetical protein ALP01_05381 [Pseudomonas caricapapayae]
MNIDGQQTLFADQRLGTLTSLGVRRNESSQGQQARLVELARHVSGTAPVLGTTGTVLWQALVQVMTQVLTVQYVDRTAHVEQLALDRIRQRTLARAGQAAEQYCGRLLAKTLRTLLGGDMGQFAMMLRTTARDRLGNDHARRHSAVGQTINDNERARGAVAAVAVQRDGRIEADLDPADLVQLQRAGRAFLQRVHIDPMGNAGNGARHIAGGTLDVVFLARQHGLFGHPYQHGVERIADLRNVVGMHQQVATGDVDFVFHGQGHSLTRSGMLQLTLIGDDGLHTAALARRQHDDLVALVHDAAGQRTGEATEIQVRTVDVLHRESQVCIVAITGDFDGFENLHQRLASVPRRTLALVHHVVALERRHRHKRHGGRLERNTLGKLQVIGLDRLEHALVKTIEVHLVDGDNDMLDAQQRSDIAVTAGLGLHAIARIHQNDRQVTGRSTSGHVTGVLLMSWRIGNDELALGRGEIAIRDIDGDALLALGLQTVHQQRQIDVIASVTGLFRVSGNSFKMIFVDHLGVVQQTPDQRALAVIDVATGEEAQHFLAFVLAQIGEDVLADQIRLMRHVTPPLEITLTFLFFHRASTVVVNDPTLAFGSSRQQHFLDDVGQAGRLGLDGTGQRVAAQSTETDLLLDDARLLFIGKMLEDALVVDHDQRTVLLDNVALGCKIQRHDRDAFEVDVLPDVQLGPVGKREHTDRLAFVDVAVIDVPQLGALVFRVPAMLAVAERVDTLLGPGLFFVASGTTEGSIETMFVERLFQALGLHDVGVFGAAVGKGVDALSHAIGIDVSDQIKAHFLDHLVTEAIHFLEFPAGIDVHDREWQFTGEECLARQVQHHGRILADRVQHHRVIELGGDLADDVDAFRLQLFQMRQFVNHGYSRSL